MRIAVSTILFVILESVVSHTMAQQVYLNASQLFSKQQKNWVVCGSDKIRIIDPEKSDSSHAEIVWEWNSDNTKSELPAAYHSRFDHMDECKPVLNNTKILVSSSTHGAMVLNISTHRCEFYCYAPMAHSGELLPNDRIVVAESTHNSGNALVVFDITSRTGSPVARDSLYSAHGVLWHNETERLYAVGGKIFRIYKLTDWNTAKPSLTLEKELTLPISGAHDLTRIDDHRMIISCTNGVYYYDTNTQTFARFQPLIDYTNLKSVNFNHQTGQIVYTLPEESWWTYHLSSLNPTFGIGMSDINVYKVRVFE